MADKLSSLADYCMCLGDTNDMFEPLYLAYNVLLDSHRIACFYEHFPTFFCPGFWKQSKAGVFITAVPITKLFACVWGGGSGGHVLRETMSRGLCGLVCPSRTSQRGGEGYCVKEGGGEEGERERERAREVRLHYSLGY
jgi:hypothetical protein